MTTNKEFTIKVKNYGTKELETLREKCSKLECKNGELFTNDFSDYFIRVVNNKNSNSNSTENIYVLLCIGSQSYTSITKYGLSGNIDNISLSIFEMLVDVELEKQEQKRKLENEKLENIERKIHQHFVEHFSEESIKKLIGDDYEIFTSKYKDWYLTLDDKE